MQVISCDVCKKKLDDPQTGRSFFYFADFSICEACRDNLDSTIRGTIRTKEPFSYEWYTKFVADTLTKSAQKGK